MGQLDGGETSPAMATGRRPRRLDWLLMAGAVLLVVLLSARWWDVARWPVPVLQAAFPLVGVLAVLWAGVVLALRRWRAALVAVAVSLVPLLLAAVTLPTSTVAARSDDEVLLVVNLEFGEADPRALMRQVAALGATTLVLTEVTPSAATGLRRAGLAALLPYSVGAARFGASGTMIHSRHRLTAIEQPAEARAFDQPIARVQTQRGPYLLRAIHTFPPQRGLTSTWRRQLTGLERWAAAQSREVPVVLAGDFNASSAHPGFRKVAAGMTEAHRAAGRGWVRTWPTERRIPAFVQLDHVLVRSGGVVDAGQRSVPGTDHAAVWARLRLGG